MNYLAKFMGIEVWFGLKSEYLQHKEFYKNKIFIIQERQNERQSYAWYNGKIMGIWYSLTEELELIDEDWIYNHEEEEAENKVDKVDNEDVKPKSAIDILIGEFLDRADEEFKKYGRML